ncbi:MAG: hypothetical protein D6722_03235 [Bacteroidetes bacterium]|nr:MAG: hypothetical protein D6722_03235 [Bacteroidota bacterium]
MDELVRRIEAVSRKAVAVQQQLAQLAQERDRLQERIAELEAQLSRRDADRQEMMEKYEAVKLAKSLNNQADREAVLAQIDLYLKEIDLCLNSFGE